MGGQCLQLQAPVLANFGENRSIIHLGHNLFSISYVGLKAGREDGEREIRIVEDLSCRKGR